MLVELIINHQRRISCWIVDLFLVLKPIGMYLTHMFNLYSSSTQKNRKILFQVYWTLKNGQYIFFHVFLCCTPIISRVGKIWSRTSGKSVKMRLYFSLALWFIWKTAICMVCFVLSESNLCTGKFIWFTCLIFCHFAVPTDQSTSYSWVSTSWQRRRICYKNCRYSRTAPYVWYGILHIFT
jgi:hypothetical protein